MPNLSDLLNASQFDGLAIAKTPAGYSVSVMTDDTWSPRVVRASAVDALLAVLAPVPACPVPLPA